MGRLARTWAALAAPVLVAGAGCAPEAPPLDAGLPPGAIVAGDAAAMDRFLACAARFPGSPFHDGAARMRARISGCARFSAVAPTTGELADAATCDEHDLLAPLVPRHPDADLRFALPVDGSRRAVGGATVGASGAVRAEVELDHPAASAAALLFPGEQAVPPARLADDEAVVHVRLRPRDGLDLAGLVDEGGQAAEMFRLRNSLFAGALLDGTWELALYAPSPGASLPRMALAAGVRSPRAAETAMAAFLDDVRGQWDLAAVPLGGDRPGACLPGLRLLPGLAPCYTLTDDALVLAWDRDGLGHALGTAPPEDEPDGAGGTISLRFDRLAAADARLAGGAPPEGGYPWGHVRARLYGVGQRMRATLVTAEGCAP